jgi:acyl carrier protein
VAFDEKLFRSTVVQALELKESEYRENLELGEVASWDSLGHLGLVASLESAFKVKFDTESIPEMNSLPKLRAALSSR